MLNEEISLLDTFLSVRDQTHKAAQPFVDFLPDPLESYVVDLAAVILVLLPAIVVWTKRDKL